MMPETSARFTLINAIRRHCPLYSGECADSLASEGRAVLSGIARALRWCVHGLA
jgi:hypothetical protein